MPLRGESLRSPIGKGEPYAKRKRRALRTYFKARRACREAVYARERMTCQRCGRLTKRPDDCDWGGDPAMAHVNENPPRSRGGDPTNPDVCELICGGCHFPHGQHAPSVERMRRILRDVRHAE